ncbi:hypothetical protein KCG44_11930 [Pacificimonas sp. WHA3]|uniref:SnoaL-like domain-containing protein n=1 Tax=Pacificimonas pallii TaxID=2827236 RepID=A0ABS6SGL7_9SPHN|nr:hypothetical protein [Pacificimonas pallii]MBV7257496.1 hypothetical protein [Pacificimonas pallii]
MKRLLMTLVLPFLLLASPASAHDESSNVLVDMFAWWNEAIKDEDALTEDAFSRFFTADAAIVVNNKVSVQGVANMVPHFRRIHSQVDEVEIVLPFEMGFESGDKIFTHHVIRARDKGSAVVNTSELMGYALLKNGKIEYIHFLSMDTGPES